MDIIVWWLFTAVLGLGFMPLTGFIFQRFEDRGWIFSKSIAILVSSMVFFWLNSMHILKFVQTNIVILTVVLIVLNLVIFSRLKLENVFRDANFVLIAVEEALFLIIYLIWVWIIGFKPEAYGTEKFMDYAFLTSMTRSLWLPFEDMWFSGEPINYYYGGQYVTAWLIKLTGINVGVGYNVMRALITTFSFCAPFSLVWQLMYDRFGRKGKEAPWVSATIAGWAVAFCGNFHYVIYGIIMPLIYSARGEEYNYWFPDSTRYIGYNPDLPDKTIHEYPAYSTVLGDLHAHYIDIIFVVAVTAIAYAYAQRVLAQAKKPRTHEHLTTKALLVEILAQPEIILIGFFTGIFRFTNFWDFPIYFVVCGSIVFFMNLWKYRKDMIRFAVVMLGQAAEAFVIGYIACLPFTMRFDQISSEIGFVHSHTVFYQFMVLWGLPLAVLVGFLIMVVLEQRRWMRDRAAVGAAAGKVVGAVRGAAVEAAAGKVAGAVHGAADRAAAEAARAEENLLRGPEGPKGEEIGTDPESDTQMFDFSEAFEDLDEEDDAQGRDGETADFSEAFEDLDAKEDLQGRDGETADFSEAFEDLDAKEDLQRRDSETADFREALEDLDWKEDSRRRDSEIADFREERVAADERKAGRGASGKGKAGHAAAGKPEHEGAGRGKAGHAAAGKPDHEGADRGRTGHAAAGKPDHEGADRGKAGHEGAGRGKAGHAAAGKPDHEGADRGKAGHKAAGGISGALAGMSGLFGSKSAFAKKNEKEPEDSIILPDTNDDDRVLFGLHLPDLVVILIGLCALGLILMPEVIYVKDIYEGEHYRANTMFKLTYQAFILFGMMMGYVIERCYLRGKRAGRAFSIVALVLVVFTAGYIFKSIDAWFGNVMKSNNRISTDASVFVDESFSTDFDAICWLNNTVTGRPVVLEAPGDSYTDYQRVSVATGLPTVLGWYVHEWLWRSDTESLNVRAADAQTIYTSQDEATVRELIQKYNITYIYIGQLERQKYPDLNDTLLQGIGQVAYSDGETTYIMKVQ